MRDRLIGVGRLTGMALCLVLALSLRAWAAEDDKPKGDVFSDPDEAARQSSNPLGGAFMILLNEFQLDLSDGDISSETRTTITHVFQPVIPIAIPAIGDDWISVTRPTLPIIYDAELPSGPFFQPRPVVSGFGPPSSASSSGVEPIEADMVTIGKCSIPWAELRLRVSNKRS